jgi:type IV secretory pathway TraG/TraD family ATPase VirD4
MMTKDLYRLPDPSTFRGFALRSFGVTLLSFALTLVLLAQHFARQLDFHPVLGRPLLPALHCPLLLLLVLAASALSCLLLRPLRPFAFVLVPAVVLLVIADEPLYSPFHLFSWLQRYRDFASTANLCQTISRWAFLAGALHGGALAVCLRLGGRPSSGDFDIHGSARWARRTEVARAGLLHRATSGGIAGPRGLFLGFWSEGGRRLPLYDDGPNHLFVFAPTRSGKGVGLVVPNLLLWRGSVVVCDIKGENYALTSGFRERELNNAILRYDPTWPDSSRWNPLDEVRLGDYEVRDAQNIADILVDPNGDRIRDHWDRTGAARCSTTCAASLFSRKFVKLMNRFHQSPSAHQELDYE